MLNQISLSGWWKIKFDEQEQGELLGWAKVPPEDCLDIHLPSCWNEVFPERFSYDGTAWYYKQVFFTKIEVGERRLLHFEGMNYSCVVYINGHKVGEHEGGFTPFSIPLHQAIELDAVNLIAIKVNSKLSSMTLPPSGVDWFNYGGIYRPITIQTIGVAFIDDYIIKTRMNGAISLTAVLVNTASGGSYGLVAKISDQLGREVIQDRVEVKLESGEQRTVTVSMTVQEPILWKLRAAYLYTLRLELLDGNGQACDVAEKRFGIREFSLLGHKILLNGEEVRLAGCAKHEEYPLTGRTVTREQLIKDYDLLRQMNANIVRLSHYPHSRLEHEVLDELGMVAISEIPMVFLREAQMTNPEIRSKSMHMLEEMIRAEKNDTCIMFWSLFIECETDLPNSREFVKAIVDLTRRLDDTRLVVMASNRPLTDVTYDLFDVVGVNYWEGWYGGEPVSEGVKFLTTMSQRYPDKPLLITSHGWEGLRGERSYVEKVPWSEDLQSDYLTKIADVYMSFKNIAGEIIWTFADFRVSNWKDVSEEDEKLTYLGRPLMVNHKGMVDYYRRPKSTYYKMVDKFMEWQEITTPKIKRYGHNLQTKIFSNRRMAGEVAAFDFIDRVQALLKEKAEINIVFASANSQTEFLETLVRNQMLVDWKRINAFHLDEFVGAGPETVYGFAHWLRNRLIDRLPFHQFHALNGLSGNLGEECERYSELVSSGVIDLACIGIGENGHIAFNDPPNANFDDPVLVKLVHLDEACREQQFREGLFPDISRVPTQALTLTIPAIMKAGEILCVVPGTHKSMAVWKMVNGDISPKSPATVLRRHAKVTLYLDAESSSLL